MQSAKTKSQWNNILLPMTRKFKAIMWQKVFHVGFIVGNLHQIGVLVFETDHKVGMVFGSHVCYATLIQFMSKTLKGGFGLYEWSMILLMWHYFEFNMHSRIFVVCSLIITRVVSRSQVILAYSYSVTETVREISVLSTCWRLWIVYAGLCVCNQKLKIWLVSFERRKRKPMTVQGEWKAWNKSDDERTGPRARSVPCL